MTIYLKRLPRSFGAMDARTRRERWLLMVAVLVMVANQLALNMALDRGLWPLAWWGGLAWGGWVLLRRALPYHDPYLYPTTLLLTGWGLTLVQRLVPNFAPRQAAWMLLGLGALLVIAALPGHLRWLRRYRYTWLGGGITLLALTILLGVNPSGVGPELWLGFGELFFQPSEFLKVILVVFLASYIADHQATLRGKHGSLLDISSVLAPMLAMWGLCLVLLIWQRDLGTMTIFFFIFVLMLYLASERTWVLVGGGLLLLMAGWVGYQFVDIIAFRVDIWRDPFARAESDSFQIVRSLMAVAEGGMIGTGAGAGLPTSIPVVHADFAYAAIVEEWGLLGGISALGGLFVIVARGLRLATILMPNKPFQAYLAAGLSIIFGIQTLMITGGALNLVPLTGITLPFLSYGGSSLVTSFIAVGLLLKLSAQEADPV